MAVLNEARVTDEMAADGDNRSWPFSFTVYSSAHLKVVVTDADGEETEVPAGDYAVALGAGDSRSGFFGGTVTYPQEPAFALAAGNTLRVEREVPLTQTISLSTASGFDPKAVERQFDLLVMALQQVRDGAVSLPLVGPGNVLSFDEDGNVVATLSPEDIAGLDVSPEFPAEISGTSFLVDFVGTSAPADMQTVRFRNQGDGKILWQLLSDDKTAGQLFMIVERDADFTIGDPDDPAYPDDAGSRDASPSAAKASKTIAFVADRTIINAEKHGTSADLPNAAGITAEHYNELPFDNEAFGLYRWLFNGDGLISSRNDSPVGMWLAIAGGMGGPAGLDKAGRFTIGSFLAGRKLTVTDQLSSIVGRFSSPNDGSCEIEFSDSTTASMPKIGADGDDLIARVGSGGDIVLRVDGTNLGVRVNGGAILTRMLRTTASLDFPSIAAGSSQTLTVTVTGAQVGDAVTVNGSTGSSVLILSSGNVSSTNTVTVRCFNISGGAVDPAAFTVSVEVRGYA